MKTHPVGVELFRADGHQSDGQTDKHNPTTIRSSKLSQRA
jgi:hypothetical protein